MNRDAYKRAVGEVLDRLGEALQEAEQLAQLERAVGGSEREVRQTRAAELASALRRLRKRERP